jgi:hypothetical protein
MLLPANRPAANFFGLSIPRKSEKKRLDVWIYSLGHCRIAIDARRESGNTPQE